MKIKIIKAKPVVQPPDKKELILNEREALFLRDLFGGLSDSQLQIAVSTSFNVGKFTPNEAVELRDELYSIIVENFT